MVASNRRITHKIVLPSYAFSKFLRKAVFDEETFALFMENSAGALKSNGIELDACVSEEALMRLRFLVVRAHDFVLKGKINSAKFEELFGVVVVNPQLKDVSIKVGVMAKAEASVDVYYSEKQTESHRGANTEFKNQDAITESRTDHWSTTKWDGKGIARPEDRFTHVPLLDAVTLGSLIAKMDSQLKELGKY
ncbi:hypothetical protein [Thiovibrio frasassiensis]|uniref:Uncharacterized protein n=1 Tax=Thiovibrio frasassiensis TaxID=2984131 RepID=A0A9X4MG81_9BACT|nr:hypothetical protein [Thiovibrio frasassiensis]MDG4476939.1 hypothetical protein [Thiovibrio frasassiensis]